MSEILKDKLNIQLARLLCSGFGVEINISELSRILKKHRNTIDGRIEKLMTSKIIDPPYCPFSYLQSILPLMVIEKADLPRDARTNFWIETDPYIEAAYFVKDEEYNTLLIEYHKDLYSYQKWKEDVKREELITPNETRQPSEALFLSVKSIIKYQTYSPMMHIEKNYNDGYLNKINGLELDEHYIDILSALLRGKGLRINDSIISREIGVHRKTVKRRIDNLIANNIISKPVCRFPRIWAPPEHFQVISLYEIKRRQEVVMSAFMRDPHVTMIIKTYTGRYNVVLISSFYKMEDHLAWQEDYDLRFPGCLGAVKNNYLSPAMTFSIAQQYIYLLYLDQLDKKIEGEAIAEMMGIDF
ncbi:MAG: Lrp/AsnC family transcriptional regulator [Candidatus Heimdallarchaeota archaeon]|nr:Lrp/AsnC family transcriptional regulator [Candidatus Heimdallarchaeota archaeon]